MPLTAPETRVSTATIQNGISAHSGSSVTRVPTGSSPIRASTSGSEPASSRPKTTRTTGAAEPPIVFHRTIAPSDVERRW